MKNYLLALLGLTMLGFSACKKDCNNLENNENQTISIINATAIKTGTLNFTNKNATGTATIYLQKKWNLYFGFRANAI